jgi:hypothetical protein
VCALPSLGLSIKKLSRKFGLLFLEKADRRDASDNALQLDPVVGSTCKSILPNEAVTIMQRNVFPRRQDI